MSELKPRPHAEIIKAWADGKTIQYRPPGCILWNDITAEYPSFFSNWEYRIKPETVKLRYRRCLVKLENSYALSFISSERGAEYFEKSQGFVKWIDTEWQYVEVEVEN